MTLFCVNSVTVMKKTEDQTVSSRNRLIVLLSFVGVSSSPKQWPMPWL